MVASAGAVRWAVADASTIWRAIVGGSSAASAAVSASSSRRPHHVSVSGAAPRRAASTASAPAASSVEIARRERTQAGRRDQHQPPHELRMRRPPA